MADRKEPFELELKIKGIRIRHQYINMPQKYIPQPGSKNIQKAYKDLDRTILAVSGDTSVHDAAKRFGIAHTVLQHRIKGHVNPHS